MLTCDKCAGQINEDSSLCPHCGDPVTDADHPSAESTSKTVVIVELSFGKSSSRNYGQAVEICRNTPSYTESGEGNQLRHTARLPITEIERDHHGISVAQTEVDFVIPFLDEDIPLYLDPVLLLWRSPSQQDQSLHTSLVICFNHLRSLMQKGREGEAVDNLITASECDEVGFGVSAKRRGKRMGAGTANEILALFSHVRNMGGSASRTSKRSSSMSTESPRIVSVTLPATF